MALNEGQRRAYEAIMSARGVCTYPSNTQHIFFIDGPVGTGKTYLLNKIAKSMRTTVSVAYTRMATNLLGGRTVFSQYQINPYNLNHPDCELKEEDGFYQEIFGADILMFDQTNLFPVGIVKAIHELLQNMVEDYLPFGGRVVVFAGDFRQFLPINNGHLLDKDEALVQLNLQESLKFDGDFWKMAKILPLTQNMRFVDNTYFEMLLQIGNGVLQEVNLPEDTFVRNLDELIIFTFGGDKVGNLDNNIILTSTVNDENYVQNQCKLMFNRDHQFAKTIHKAHGVTFEKVGLFLRNPLFAHGHLYVALASVRDVRNLRIKNGQFNELNVGPLRNIVSARLLDSIA